MLCCCCCGRVASGGWSVKPAADSFDIAQLLLLQRLSAMFQVCLSANVDFNRTVQIVLCGRSAVLLLNCRVIACTVLSSQHCCLTTCFCQHAALETCPLGRWPLARTRKLGVPQHVLECLIRKRSRPQVPVPLPRAAAAAVLVGRATRSNAKQEHRPTTQSLWRKAISSTQLLWLAL